MLTQEQKDVFAKLDCEFQPVAVKFYFAQPEGVEHVDQELSFCQFVKKAQTEHKVFYTTADDDNCGGKFAIGQVGKPALGAAGIPAFDFGVYGTTAAGARLYDMMPTLSQGAHNYTVFAPVALCNFDPDLIICIANTAQAEIIMRASSYFSGDLWESRSSSTSSCVWTYAYPLISGKVNFCISGMHHGMKRRKVYPEGMHIIAIPFQKIPETTRALAEMDWQLIATREDEESKAELARRMARWAELDGLVLPDNE